MVPRTEIIAVDVSIDIDEVKKIFIEKEKKKYPQILYLFIEK